MFDLKGLLKEAKSSGIRPKKSLGQHFLIDPNYVNKILKESGVTSEDTVLEVGAGLGSLTFPLSLRAKRVIAVEIDDKLCEFLKERASDLPIELIQGDILNVDLRELYQKYGPLKVLGNLPYNLSVSILFYLLSFWELLKDLTLMFQKEVAERIVSPPGGKAYGALSVTVRTLCEPKFLFKVPRGAFWPPPEVEGGVVFFQLHKNPKGDIETLRRFVTRIFSKRRKTILNALVETGFGKREEMKDLLLNMGIDPRRRPESLGIEDFLNLYKKLEEKRC
jgi:16S rRNA (adenine1518-N6/adenine1519-N6)-dimethyltransferase